MLSCKWINLCSLLRLVYVAFKAHTTTHLWFFSNRGLIIRPVWASWIFVLVLLVALRSHRHHGNKLLSAQGHLAPFHILLLSVELWRHFMILLRIYCLRICRVLRVCVGQRLDLSSASSYSLVLFYLQNTTRVNWFYVASQLFAVLLVILIHVKK